MRTQLKTAMTGNKKYWVVLRKVSLGSTPYYDVSAHNQSLTSLDAGITQMFGSLEGAEAFFERIMEDNKAAVRIIKSTVTGNKKYVVNHTLHGDEHRVELREAGINGETIRRICTPYLARARNVFEGMMEANEAPKPELIKSELTPNKRLNVQMYRLNGRYTVSTSSTEGFCIQMRHFDGEGSADVFWRSVMRLNGPARQDAPKAEPLLDRIASLEKRVETLEAHLAGAVVMIDGTCSGIQHYGSMMRDSSGKPTGSWVKKLFK